MRAAARDPYGATTVVGARGSVACFTKEVERRCRYGGIGACDLASQGD